jgi:hypothetical protein
MPLAGPRTSNLMVAVTNEIEMSKQQNTKTSADSGRQAPTDQLVRHCALACTTSLTSTLGQFIRKGDVHEAV